MKFLVDWLNVGDSTAPELAATACQLTIDISNMHVSHFVDHRHNREAECITMPAYPLAEGLANRWWALIAGRTGTIRLRAFREGFAVPDVRMSPDGRNINITIVPFQYPNPPVSFDKQTEEHIGVAAFAQDARHFIESVLARLQASHVSDTVLAQKWASILTSFTDDQERAFCEAAGAMGIDPYTCTDREAQLIAEASTAFAGEALLEYLAGQQPENVPAGIAWVNRQERVLGPQAALPALAAWAHDVRTHLNGSTAAQAAWRIGTGAARESRAVLNMGEDRIFHDVSDLAGICGNAGFAVAPDYTKALRACVSPAGGSPRVFVGRQTDVTTNVFTLARAIGDFVVFGNPGRSPITDTQSSFRQAIGRAFAAEFLAPANVVISMTKDGHTMDDIATARGVASLVVLHQIENNRHLLAA